MERIWSFFVNKSGFTSLILIALLIFGFGSIATIPRESNPEVIIPIAIVSTVFPGASAEDVETLITNKIEDALSSGLDEVDNITSNSSENVSSVVVEFNPTADIDKSIQETKDEVDKVKSELPEDANEPNVIQVDFADQPILMLSVASDLPITEFIRLSDEVIEELESVKGVSKVEKSGVREREAQVIIRQEALKKFNIRLTDVIWAIQSANSALPVGNIQMSNAEYALRFEGDISDPAQIQDIAILNNSGQPIYIRDLAFVSDGVSKTNSFSRISTLGSDPSQAMSLSIYKQSGGDITRISKAVQDRLQELETTTLKNSEVLIVYDMGDLIETDLINLSLTALQTVILVMIILLIALGWRESLIAGLAIPMSFLIAFIGLNLSGNTINFVSLFSLILAVGILVDSAIVMTEGIHSKIGKFKNKSDSAKATIKEFHWPLTSGTMTTIAVFAPLFLISGIVGQFIASIPFTIIFVLLASLFVALGLVPLFASLILRPTNSRSRFNKKREFYTIRLQSWYQEKLENFISSKRNQRIFFASLTGLFILALALPITGIVKTTFFPPEDSEFIFLEVEKPKGTLLGQTDLVVRQIEEVLQSDTRIESFITTVGGGSPFTGGIVGGGGGASHLANITILLKEDRSQNSLRITTDIRKDISHIKSAEIRISQADSGPPSDGAVTLRFLSEDLIQLEAVANKATAILKEIPGTVNVQSSAANDNTEFVLEIDRAKASELGLNISSIAQTLRAAVNGQTATTIKTGTGKEIDVEVKLDLNQNFITPHDTTRATIDEIRNLEIQSPSGPILLGSIINFSVRKSSASINHEDLDRVITVTSDLAEGYLSSEILKNFNKEVEALDQPLLPNGVELKIGGEQEEINQSFRDMFIALIIGVILILSILVLQFNSYRQAFIIISIVPLTTIGIFFGLFISGKTLSFPSIMGFIALTGIVVNNSIILIDRMNNLRLAHPHENLKRIVVMGAVSRLRPILLTTLTTVIGIIPLTYASGLWSPLAFSIIFGLSFAVVVTLWLVPTLYYRKYSRRPTYKKPA